MSLFQIDAGHEWRDTERQAFFLARELQKARFPSVLVVLPESPLQKKAVEAGLPTIPIKMGNGMGFPSVLRLAAAMRRRRCVLAHFHDAKALVSCSRAASLAKVPIRVLSRRADFADKSPRRFMKNIHAVIAVSEGVKNVLIRGGMPSRFVKVVPAGIDFSPFEGVQPRDFLRREFGFAAEDFLVGVVVHLEDEVGHRYLVEAAKILGDRAPKAKIIVIGEGSLRLEFDKSAHDFKAPGISYYLGFPDRLPQVLASLDAFAASSHLEGLNGSLLNAMASRIPVVAADVGGIPDIVVHRETGLLVPPRDPKSLAEAILKLYLDRTLASRLAEHGYAAVQQKYSAEAMARRIIEIYGRLASEKGVSLA